MTESNMGRKSLIFVLSTVFHHPVKSSQELKHGRNLETELMEGSCLLVWLLQNLSACFLTREHHMPRVGIPLFRYV